MVTQSIPLVADLRTQNRNIGTIYLATGLVTEGDTGGGIYFWNPASTNADDGFYYLQVTGVATGRWARIYAGSNIYNTDGSLLDNRDVTLSGSYLKFIGSSANSTFNADGTVTLSSLSGVNTRMVVAGATGTLATQSFVPGTTIRFVEKFSATLGQTVFNTTNTLYSDLFDVFLNGVKLNTDSFSFTANQITLLDGSYAGDIIDVVGFSSATVYASLPSQTGNAGKFLSTDGTNLSWETVSVAGFVPYTGATADVNLGEFGLSAGQLTLDVSPTGTAAVGTTRWNNTIGSSETTLKGGSVILKNGVDLVARVVNKVFPNATLTKAAYQAVRVSGAQGQRLAVAFAQANNDANSADTIGLVCETIATNQEGFIITVGQLENINTTGSLQGETWVDGDVLYLSPTTPGAITKVKPTGNGHIVVIGYVEYAHANNGKIYVKVMNGWELTELHDCDIVTPANNEALIYESSTQLWKNKTIATALGYTPISGTGVSGQVAYWNGTNSQTGSATLTYTPTTSLLVNNSVTAATAIARGTNLTPTLVASANNDVLVGLEVTPTFTNGAFTGVQNLVARFRGARGFVMVESSVNSNNTAIQLNALTSNGTAVAAGFYQIPVSTTQSYFSISGDATNTHLNVWKNGNVVLQASGTPPDGGQRLQVYGDAFVRGSGATSATNALLVQNSAGTQQLIFNNAGQAMFGINTPSANVRLETDGTFRAWTQVEVGQFGNVVINTTQLSKTASGSDFFQFTNNASHTATSGSFYFLQVRNTVAPTSGTGIFNNLNLNITINQTGGANGITRGLYVNPTLTAAADWRSIEWSNNSGWGLYGDGSANNFLRGSLGIGTTSALSFVNVNLARRIGGSATAWSFYNQGQIQSDVTNTAFYFSTEANTQATAFTVANIFHYNAQQSAIGLGSSVINQFGYAVNSTLIGATNNYGFYGNIPNAANRWNLYMNGTADNYLRGKLLINTTTVGTFDLDVNGTARVSGAATFGSTSSFGGNMTLTLNQNAATAMSVINTTSNTNAYSTFVAESNGLGLVEIGKYSQLKTSYKILGSGDGFIYNAAYGDFAILNDFASGTIKFAAGGSSTAHMTIKANGRINMSSLPTSSAGLSAGDLWNDGGTLKIV